jgi:hypothetical protein
MPDVPAGVLVCPDEWDAQLIGAPDGGRKERKRTCKTPEGKARSKNLQGDAAVIV